MKTNSLDVMAELQHATLVARKYDPQIAVRVKNGKFQVVRVLAQQGKADLVQVISDWLPADEAIKFLDNIE